MSGTEVTAVSAKGLRFSTEWLRARFNTLHASAFLRNSFTLLSGSIATQLVAAVTAPVLGRIYRPGEYGVLGLFLAISGFLGVVASLQMPTAIVVPRADERARALVHLSIAAAIALGLGATLPLLVFRYRIAMILAAPGLSAWLPLVPAAVALSTAVAAINSYANRLHAYRAMSLSRFFGAIVGAAISILVGRSSAHWAGLFVGFFAGIVTTLLILVVAARREDPLLFRRIGVARLYRVLGRYRKFATISTLAELLNNLVQQLPLYTISALAGAAAGGLYAMTNRLLGLPNVFISSAVGEVFRRRASIDYAAHGSCRPIYAKTARTLIALGLLPTLLLFLFGPQIFSIYLGPQWKDAGVYARVLSPLFLIRFVVSPLSYVFFIAEHQREDLLAHIAMIAVTVGGMYAGYRTSRAPTTMLAWYAAGYSAIYLYYLVRGYSISQRVRRTPIDSKQT